MGHTVFTVCKRHCNDCTVFITVEQNLDMLKRQIVTVGKFTLHTPALLSHACLATYAYTTNRLLRYIQTTTHNAT